MARWIQVLAVALAAVVGLVPAFAQLGYAQAVPVTQIAPVLPSGEEVTDAELAEVDGEAWPVLTPFLLKMAKWALTAIFLAEMAVQRGCDMAVNLGGQAVDKVVQLTMKGVTFAAVKATEHPLVRDTLLGVGFGVAGSVVHAEIKNQPLTDVAIGVVTGGVFGAAARGIGRGLEELAKRGR